MSWKVALLAMLSLLLPNPRQVSSQSQSTIATLLLQSHCSAGSGLRWSGRPMLARLAAALSPRPYLLGIKGRPVWQHPQRARAPARWAPALFHTMATLQKVGARHIAQGDRMLTCN